MSEDFKEIAKDRAKMENMLNDMGLSSYVLGYTTEEGQINIVDTTNTNLLGTFGLFEVMKEKMGLDKKRMFNKSGSSNL